MRRAKSVAVPVAEVPAMIDTYLSSADPNAPFSITVTSADTPMARQFMSFKNAYHYRAWFESQTGGL